MKALRTIFCATPDIAIPCLEELNKNSKINLIKVYSMPSRPFGRKKELKDPEVITYCKQNQISYYQSANINNDHGDMPECDLIIVFAFAQFLKKEILNAPKIGCFNIHTSILPKYRGAAPIQYALLNGDKETGVCIQKMVKKMDAGDIYEETKVEISETDTYESLYNKLKSESVKVLKDFISNVSDEMLSVRSQNESEVSFAPSVQKNEGELDFKNNTALEIERRSRAFYPWPGVYTFLDGKRLKINKLCISDKNIETSELFVENSKIYIGTKKGSIELLEVQLEGKKACQATDLLNGYKGELKLTDGK